MGLLGGLFKAVVEVAILPGAVVADIVTLGNAGTTESTIDRMKDDLGEVDDALTGNDDFL